MFDHSKESMREACGISEKRWSELHEAVRYAIRESEKWSEVVERIIKMEDLNSVEKVLAGAILGVILGRFIRAQESCLSVGG
ncbi:MAG: hypothetical protein DRJ64_03685 [Thermoprotei archaeon]|nr:MAG: hypothetical protein DRJ64_03685 [Thermoprotei archaeon]